MYCSCAADTAGVDRSEGKWRGEDNPWVGTTFRTKAETSKQVEKNPLCNTSKML